jgi:hypothetical protein
MELYNVRNMPGKALKGGILDREHSWFLVFKTPLNMSEGERRTSLKVESK